MQTQSEAEVEWDSLPEKRVALESTVLIMPHCLGTERGDRPPALVELLERHAREGAEQLSINVVNRSRLVDCMLQPEVWSIKAPCSSVAERLPPR